MDTASIIEEKIKQAPAILREKGIDLWLTFVRESSVQPDPVLELILGAGCVWQSAFILTADGDRVAIVGSLDQEGIRSTGHYKEIIGYVASIRDSLVQVLERFDPKTIAVNFSKSDIMSDGLTHGMYLLLEEYLKDTPYFPRLRSSEGVVSAIRGRKSPQERSRIREAIGVTLKIFDEVSGFLKPGQTEKEIARFINEKMREAGVEPAWDPVQCPAVFTGPESAGAHAGPTDRMTERGHLMNIDFGVKVKGFCSDLQRTWYYLKEGETGAPPDVRKGFLTIRDAIRKAAEGIRPGLEGWTIDDMARSYIVSQAYAEYPHALGHQIGRAAHDGAGLLCPRWERYGKLPYDRIEAGQVYTVEPRLTVEGRGVATIEEIIVVTEDGCEFLSTPQDELLLVG